MFLTFHGPARSISVKKKTPLAPIPRHIIPENTQPTYLVMIHFNIIFLCTCVLCHIRGLFPSSFLTTTLYALLSSPCHMPCQSDPWQYWHTNNSWVVGIVWLQAKRSEVQTSLKRKNFWTHADQPQVPPNFLYNLHNVSFPGVNQPGLAPNTHPRLALRLSVDTARLYHSSKPA